MEKFKISLLLLLIIILTGEFIKILILYFSNPLPAASNIVNVKLEKRGTPPYNWVIGKDLLPHIRLFFLVPINSCGYKAFTDSGVKTYVPGHGAVDNWRVNETEKILGNEKLVYIFIPKTFMILHGKNFYKLIHIYYE